MAANLDWYVRMLRALTDSYKLVGSGQERWNKEPKTSSYNGEKKQGSESAVSMDRFLEWNCKLYIHEYV